MKHLTKIFHRAAAYPREFKGSMHAHPMGPRQKGSNEHFLVNFDLISSFSTLVAWNPAYAIGGGNGGGGLHFSDWGGHPSTLWPSCFPSLFYSKRHPSRNAVKIFNMMKNSAPNRFILIRLHFQKAPTSEGAHPPSDTTLLRTSVTASAGASF